MLIWRHHMYSEERAALAAVGDRVTVGRSPDCDIALMSPYIADQALLLERNGAGWILEATGSGGCELSGLQLQEGARAPLVDGAEVRLRPFVLKFELRNAGPNEKESSGQLLDKQIAAFIGRLHVSLLAVVDRNETDNARDQGGECLLRMEHAIDEMALQQGLMEPSGEAILRRLAGHAVRNFLIDRIIGDDPHGDPLRQSDRKWVRLASSVDEREQDLQMLALKLERELEISSEDAVSVRMVAIDDGFWKCWEERFNLLRESYAYLAFREIKKQMKDIVFGYGPIEDLLRLPTVSEIMVVGHEQIFIEKRLGSGGSIENSGRRFISEQAALAVIERIVSLCNRRIDQAQPIVDARLQDGSRVNAVIAPVAVEGPCLTIRKFPGRQHRIQDWIRGGGLPEIAAKFLEAAVRERKNILVAGGTGAGKTTLLNCLADWIQRRERIVTIEDTAELQLLHDHVVKLQTKMANIENAGAIPARELVKNALRMRPDRIIVGECRGPEALDMLNAMNTGHDGSMTTLHANSPQEVVSRLESLVKTAANFSEEAIHQHIASAIDLIVQVEHLADPVTQRKRRMVTHISEVRAIDPETGRVEVVDLYAVVLDAEGTTLRPTGRLARFSEDLLKQGLFSLENCFLPSQAF